MEDIGRSIGNMIGCLFIGFLVSATATVVFFIMWLLK